MADELADLLDRSWRVSGRPVDEGTRRAFRFVLARPGRPDVVFTEPSAREARANLVRFLEAERTTRSATRPIPHQVQIVGRHAEPRPGASGKGASTDGHAPTEKPRRWWQRPIQNQGSATGSAREQFTAAPAGRAEDSKPDLLRRALSPLSQSSLNRVSATHVEDQAPGPVVTPGTPISASAPRVKIQGAVGNGRHILPLPDQPVVSGERPATGRSRSEEHFVRRAQARERAAKLCAHGARRPFCVVEGCEHRPKRDTGTGGENYWRDIGH
jgi:hypothetical protein